MNKNHIIFYDGDCGFCNFIVGFILKNEKEPIFHFSALQSEYAQSILTATFKTEIDYSTFYYLTDGKLYKKSNGFFVLLQHLKYPIRLLRIFRFIPSGIADKIYDFIAERRKKILGERCYLPTPEERKRFIL